MDEMKNLTNICRSSSVLLWIHKAVTPLRARFGSTFCFHLCHEANKKSYCESNFCLSCWALKLKVTQQIHTTKTGAENATIHFLRYVSGNHENILLEHFRYQASNCCSCLHPYCSEHAQDFTLLLCRPNTDVQHTNRHVEVDLIWKLSFFLSV